MITDQDIEKLKDTFFTKEDAEKLKDTFFTKEDAEKLKDVFATKDEHYALSRKVDGIQEQLGDLKVEVGEIHEKVDSLDVKFDAMLGLLTDNMQEHGAGAVHLARHDRQIGALATATGATLPD